MKKNILLITLFLTFSLVYSQNSLQIKDNTGTEILNNDTVYVYGDASDYEIIEDFVITNLNASSLSVKAKKNDVSLQNGTQHAFCWAGLCYSTSTIISPLSLAMASGFSTSGGNNLSSHYRPFGNSGTSIITLTVFDMNNVSDSAMVTVIYDALLDVKDINTEFFINSPYPNPSNTKTTFQYNLNGSEAYLNLYNIVGNRIATYKLDGDQFILNTEELQSGIYFYTISANGLSHGTKRLIVSH